MTMMFSIGAIDWSAVSIDVYCEEVRRLAAIDGATNEAAGVFDPEHWEADQAAGLTPAEAWAEERACREEHDALRRETFFQRSRK